MDITSNFQNKYSNKWGVLLQQKVSRIKEFVTVKTDCSGKVVFHDQFGTLEFEEKTTRKGTTKVDDAPTDRRALHPKFFHKTIGMTSLTVRSWVIWMFRCLRRLRACGLLPDARWTR